MSRDLVTFNRTERDRKNKDAVEQLCTDMGCSEPVARNFLKYKKFGIGPLADFGAERARQRAQAQRPKDKEDDQEADPLQKFKRVQDLEKRLQEQKEKEERAEQEMLEEMKKKRQSKRAGLKPLGPVMAREEAVDPLQKVATEAPEPEEQQAPDPEDSSGQWLSVPRSADWKKEDEDKKKKLQEQQHHKHKKKKKRRREDEEKSEESEHARRRVRSRSRSVPEEETRKGSSSSAGLMTEKEVLAMMGKEKAKEKPQRGSMQAKLRIQREMQEWNSTKAENEEFWKAPRFALCYSAETSRTLRGNTGPNLAEAHRKADK